MRDLIGIPFAYRGRGPDEYDCYGLLRELYRRDGIEIPDYFSPSDGARITAIFNTELRLWQECKERRGAAALFRIPGNMHVGYCLGDGRFIHTWEGSGGVCIERLEDWKNRLIGIYEYVG